MNNKKKKELNNSPKVINMIKTNTRDDKKRKKN